MTDAPPALHAPGCFVLSTITQRNDEEQDRSLMYTCATQPAGLSGGDKTQPLVISSSVSPTASRSTNTLKGLSLAVRGVLDSICGEKTRVIHLGLRDGSGTSIRLTFAHLQVCMVVLVLPDSVAEDHASALVLQVTQTLIVLAGSSELWMETGEPPSSYPHLKKEVKVLMDRVFEGLFRQLQGIGWQRVVPGLIFEAGVVRVLMPQVQQAGLTAMVHSYQGLDQSATTSESSSPPVFTFHKRQACLMYRGLMSESTLDARHTKLIWQLCWSLQLFSQAHSSGLPCQVITHRIYLESSAEATATGAAAAAAAAVAAATASGGGGGGAGVLQHSSAPGLVDKASGDMNKSLLVLVSAHHLVLAVILTAYEQEIDEDVIGRLEGQAAVELLQNIHTSFGGYLETASKAAVFFSTTPAAKPSHQLPAVPEGHRKTSQRSPGLFARLVNKRLSKRHLSPPSRSPVVSPHLGPGSPASSATPISGMGHHLSGSFAVNSNPHSTTALPMSPGMMGSTGGGAVSVGGSSVAQMFPDTILLQVRYNASDGGICLTGHATILPSLFQSIVVCRARFSNCSTAMFAPPQHSRLCMTLDQVEQLSAQRSQREGGTRLGTADSSPWQYHPELASLTAVQTVTICLPASTAASVLAGLDTPMQLMTCPLYLTACRSGFDRALEVFVCHTGNIDERKCLDNMLHLEFE